ncbi:lanthionine synthetase C family protein [Paenibacillus bovis]|uniref:Lantibiotic biosynthesis protein n=1 Tax=Paenibacillus bovis TaxID=1616788 RepID=A0A172ZCS1_9BACL|nr:lanthionine synthetase C family protein [Paenibacillus bovis]ANF94950.1 hypothetical protein AR543_02135 [Paenibacillus bovis]
MSEIVRESAQHTELSAKAKIIAMEVAERLKNPLQVKEQVMAPGNISVFGDHPWQDTLLSAGYPGIILLFGELDRQFPEDNWDMIAHDHLLALQEGLRNEGYPNASMFSGLAGVAVAIKAVSHGGTRYQGFLDKLNELIIAEVEDKLRRDEYFFYNNQGGVSPVFYDVIMGLTGTGRYLLEIADEAKAKTTLCSILSYMVELAQPITINGRDVPGWYVPEKHQFTDEDKKRFPNGNFNCGLAHGIPGPMALLSIALIHNIEVEGQREAVEVMARWLIDAARTDESGIYWTSFISYEEQTTGQTAPERARDAWCYGAAGTARALFLAGKALDNEEFYQQGLYGFDSIFKRGEAQWQLSGPTFCHGYAGLLHITSRMAAESGEERFHTYIKEVLSILLRHYDPELPFVFGDLEVQEYIHKAGILDGAAGVALTLLSLDQPMDKLVWDHVFVIA